MISSFYNSCLTASLTLSLAGLGQGHLIMKSPIPYGVDTLNNSPLVDTAIGSSTSDFPCKQRSGVYDISTMNNMAVGESQTLSFTGSASHGGGTCQLAVSLDKEPTANSTWKLIQVYEGGCPVTAAGNAGTDTFTYSIPKGFPNGQATLAWTWYNRIGNREIYMNCAPITVTGGDDNQDYYNTLPDMYIINLPSSQCSSVETSNQIIPNPGQFVLKGDTADKLASATGPACAAAAAAQTQGVTGYQSAAASNGAGLASGATTAAVTATTSAANNGLYTQASAAGTGTAIAGTAVATFANTSQYTSTPPATLQSQAAVTSGFVTLPSQSALSLAITVPVSNTIPAVISVATPVLQTTAALETMSPVATTAGAAASGATGYSSGSGSGSSGSGTACSQDGAVVCKGPTQFGLCNNGQVVWQAVAAGTTCSNGVIQKRGIGRAQQLGRWFS